MMSRGKISLLYLSINLSTCIALSSDVEVSVSVLRKSLHPSYEENQSFLSCIHEHKILMSPAKFLPTRGDLILGMNTCSFVPGVVEIRARVCVRETNTSRRLKKQNISLCNTQKVHHIYLLGLF